MKAATIKRYFYTPGFLNRDEAELLYDTAIDARGDVIEIGSHLGKSSVVLADAALEVHKKLYAIDTWAVWPLAKDMAHLLPNIHPHVPDALLERSCYDLFMDHVRYATNVVVLKGSSVDMMPQCPDGAGLIFIDGDHSYEAVKKDLEMALAKKPKMIACHDYLDPAHPGVVDATLEAFGRGAAIQKGFLGVWRV